MTNFANTLLSVLTDIRYALRGLKNAPGYAVTMVLTLALGLGAATTMLAIVDSVLLRPMALPRPEQLVTIFLKGDQPDTIYQLTYPQIDELRRNTRSFVDIGAYNTSLRPVGAGDGSRATLLTEVSPNFFPMLGLAPKFGRLLTAADANAPVAVVSAAFWRERLHGDPEAMGGTVRLSNRLLTVVGVLPDGVPFPVGTEAQTVYTPLSLDAKGQDDLFSGSAVVLARIKPGVPIPAAREEARRVFAHMKSSAADRRQTLAMLSYREHLTGDLRPSLLLLLGGVGVLLLIACANAANLQIARVTGRLAEMDVRSALGASFVRLLRQILTESLVVSLLGAAAGGALAFGLVALARQAYGKQFARFNELAVHPAVFAAGALLAVAAGALASLAPMLSIRRQTRRSMTAARTTPRSRLPGTLVTLQIALTCVLLAVAGLFVKTFIALEHVKLGFDPHNVTTLVLLPQDQHTTSESSRQTVTRLLDGFAALPGVESATMQSSIPFSNFNVTLDGTTEVAGRAFQKGDRALYSLVSSNFVHASGVHLLRGRAFLPEDGSSPAMVALVNEAFVQQYLSGRDPIGASLKIHREPGETDADLPLSQPITVIGVLENEVQGGDLGVPYQPMVYLDYRQIPKGSGFAQVFSIATEFAVRSTLPQAALDNELRSVIKQVAPDQSEINLQPMEVGIARSLSQRRLALRLVAAFGAVALVLAAVGVYGVLAYAVAQRRREIGIRMALGSSRGGAVKLVARQAAAMVVLGFLLGGAAAWPASHAVKTFLFGVRALDPWTILGSASILLLVSGIAAAVPAWRAAQVDPLEALRAE